MKKKVAEVVQSEEVVPFQVLATAIRDIGGAVRKLEKVLTQRAIVLLLNDASRVPMYQVQRILDSMTELENLYLQPQSKCHLKKA